MTVTFYLISFLLLIITDTGNAHSVITSRYPTVSLKLLQVIFQIQYYSQVFKMSSIQQVQQVAKKLESMLETALSQLKNEQKKRKESENRLMELELELVNKEHEVKTLENHVEEITREKDEKISNLETSINFLQSVIIDKEQEILRLQEISDAIDTGNDVADATHEKVEKFEQTLNRLLENSNHNDVVVGEDGAGNNEDSNDGVDMITDEVKVVESEELTLDEDNINPFDQEDGEEEYILDESMEDLQNEENSIAEITEESVDIKEEIINKAPSVLLNVDNKSKVCPVCGIEFKTKGKLKEHQKAADHASKFECNLCNKLFSSKGTLTQHKLRIHSDVMPFKCSKCDKRFKDAGSCRRHEANDSVHIR